MSDTAQTARGDERDGENRHTWYTNGRGQVVNTWWYGWYSERQTRNREALALILAEEMYKASPLLRALHGK